MSSDPLLPPGTWCTQHFSIKTVGPGDSSEPGYFEATSEFYGAEIKVHARSTEMAAILILNKIVDILTARERARRE